MHRRYGRVAAATPGVALVDRAFGRVLTIVPRGPTRCHDLLMPIRLAIMACGVLVGAFTLSVAREGRAFSATQGTLGGLALLLGACVALTGAAAWNATRRGRRTVAVLLLLAAVSWCLAEWGNPAAGSVVFTIGLAFFAATPVLVLHAAAAAAGITTSRSARIVVVSGYV